MVSTEQIAVVRKLIIAGVLDAPVSFLNSSDDRLCLVMNGCGSADAKFDLVPDTIYGVDISAACHIHDFDYRVGISIEDKEEADRRMRNNQLRLVNRDVSWWRPKLLMRVRVQCYYLAVCWWGGPAFWNGKNHGT